MESCTLVTCLKNESENVLTMLKSCEGLYSAYVIGFDDKATDGTKEIVTEYFKEKDIRGIMYDFTWNNNFSDARNNYLNLAYEHFPENNWNLILDGDDILNPGKLLEVPDSREQVKLILNLSLDRFQYEAINAYVYLDIDEYGIPLLFYPRVHMVRNLPHVRFMFASHNTIDVPGEKQILIKEFIVIHKQKPKKRRERELQRVEMNIPNLEDQTASDGATDSSRGYFYLGNTYMDAGEIEKAKECYEKYLEISTWPDERYQARIHLGGISFMQGNTEDAYIQTQAALHESNQWARTEAYILLADCCLVTGQITQAIHWLEIASRLKPPVNGLFLQGHLYTWLPHWRLMLLYDKLSNWTLALQHAKISATWRPMPEMKLVIELLTDLAACHSADETRTLDDDVRIYPIREQDIQSALSLGD